MMLMLIFAVLVIFLLSLPGGAQGIALFLAGIAATGLTEIFKGSLTGRWAVTVSIVVSFVIAVFATWLAGDIHNISWGDLTKNVTTVIAVAQLVYQYITQKSSPPSTTRGFQ